MNEVIAKRMVKKQQIDAVVRGRGAFFITDRTSVLNDELREQFEEWYPEMKTKHSYPDSEVDLPVAA